MREWLSYSLADFLMFGPDVYWRLFELHNQALWPLPVGAFVLGVVILLFLTAAEKPRRYFIGLACALCWVCSTNFLQTRYGPINWPAAHATWLFGIEATMIAAAVLSGNVKAAYPGALFAGWTGTGLLAYSVLLHPFMGLPFGPPLAQAELLGLAPDTTALATLGLLLLVKRGWWRFALAIVPVAWGAANATTLLALGELEGCLLVVALVLFLIGSISPATSDRARE